MDLYWGGPQRRITGLTLRILGVNVLALVILLVGVIYLGQVERNLIEARLETFQAEASLVAAALSQEEFFDAPAAYSEKLRHIVRNLALTSSLRIVTFNEKGDLITDSQNILTESDKAVLQGKLSMRESLYSVELLKQAAQLILSVLPGRGVMAQYDEPTARTATSYYGVQTALSGEFSMSAWRGQTSKIILSAAVPAQNDRGVIGALYLSRNAIDIESDLGDIWLNILRVFAVTLAVTAFLSIYLSGVIARPLRKLAEAAEAMRTGKAEGKEIPDLSHRHDEIGELSVVLRDMTRALWGRMDSIEQFAADVAHELKNPLTSLRSAVETASVVKKPEDRERLMQIILKDVMRMDRLISDISNASRLDAELSRQAHERISLKSVLLGLLDSYQDPLKRSQKPANFSWSYRVIAEGRELCLQSDLTQDVLVWGLEGRVGQVFRNVIENALSFTPVGGKVIVNVQDNGQQMAVTVQDQGPGIPESRLQHIFERFYSERPGHEDFGNHSGLGLTIARQIVHALGGAIYAENAVDASGDIKGARFIIILNKAG